MDFAHTGKPMQPADILRSSNTVQWNQTESLTKNLLLSNNTVTNREIAPIIVSSSATTGATLAVVQDHTKYAGTQPAVTAPFGILNSRMVDVSEGAYRIFALYRQVYPDREYEWDTPYTLGKRNRTKLTKLNAHVLTNEHKYGQHLCENAKFREECIAVSNKLNPNLNLQDALKVELSGYTQTHKQIIPDALSTAYDKPYAYIPSETEVNTNPSKGWIMQNVNRTDEFTLDISWGEQNMQDCLS